MGLTPVVYFRKYRENLGFSNQNNAKAFLSGKDILPAINYEYINLLTNRIEEIVYKLNSVVHETAKLNNIKSFCQKNIYLIYEKIKSSNIIPRLNNQGRRPEDVLFSWMRGFVITEFFIPSLAKIFNVDLPSIIQVGEDDLNNIDLFRRAPTADLEISLANKIVRIEVQSGFQGINDIKEHKVREALRVFENKGCPTLAVHFDLFNGQVAFVRLDTIESTDINWVTRQQMEGQSVFNIDQNFFEWRLLNPIPSFDQLAIEI